MGVLILIAGFVIATSLISAPYTELVPGDAMPVSNLITVPHGRAHPIHGKVLLTDVGVQTLHYLEYYWEQVFPNRANTIVPTGEITANLPESEFDAQGTVDMAESQMTATSVALRQLGYSVPERDIGVTLYVIDPGSPAWNTLQVGDVITSIDGVATTNPLALQNAVRSHQPGDTVTIRVGSIAHPTPGHDVSVRLGSITSDHKKVAFLGIGDPVADIAAMGTQPQYDFPFPVSINSDDIGGPSAGLAWTLGILNALGGGDLTGGQIVAATGTIRPDGTVGDVGGVQQKTVAVERRRGHRLLRPRARARRGPVHGRSSSEGLRRAVAQPGPHRPRTPRRQARLGGHGPPAGPGGHSVPTDWQESPWS